MCGDQMPAVNEKVAASLNLLRVAFLPGLSTVRGIFASGTTVALLPACSGGSHKLSAANSGSSPSEITGTD